MKTPRSCSKWPSVIVLAITFGLMVRSASAGAILFPSDIFTVYDSSGNVTYTASISEFDENTGLTFFVTTIPGDPSQDGNPTYLTEPGGGFSDAFGVYQVPVYDSIGDCIAINYFVAFSSDSEVSPIVGVPGITLPEGNGGPFDATMYLSPGLRDQGYTATFQSDAEGVPDNGKTFTLFSVVLSLLGMFHRKLAVGAA